MKRRFDGNIWEELSSRVSQTNIPDVGGIFFSPSFRRFLIASVLIGLCTSVT